MHSEKIRFESGCCSNLLVWSPENPADLVQYQLHLLVRQRPGYLLPCFLRFREGKPELCLDLTGLDPIDQAVTGNDLNPRNGRSLLLELLEALQDAVDRLLPIRQFSLHPSLIFHDADSKLKLAFWPANTASSENSDEEDFREIQSLLRSIGQAYHLPSGEIERYMQEGRHGGINLLYQQVAAESAGSDACQTVLPGDQPIGQKARTRNPPVWKSRRFVGLFAMHFLGVGMVVCQFLIHLAWPGPVKSALIIYMASLTVLDIVSLTGLKFSRVRQAVSSLVHWLGALLFVPKKMNTGEADAQTVLLAANPADFRMALLSEGLPGTPEENEGLRAYILIDEFVIGRDQKTSDLCLNDPGVGRQHARIIRRAGSFFICDLGSRNGTCLDGRKILKNVENILPDQCQISFAGRSFYFQAD